MQIKDDVKKQLVSHATNIMFVYPPKPEVKTLSSDIPLSILYLSGAIRDMCDQIHVFDFNSKENSDRTFQAQVKRLNPSIIAINCLYSAVFPYVRHIAKMAKKISPIVKVITGGLHPTLFAKEIMDNCIELDAVMIGEGEIAFPRLIRYYWEELSENELDSIYLRTAQGILHRPKLQYIEDVDAIPNPGYEYFNYDDYAFDTSDWINPKGISISKTQMPILTSRSCPNQCPFCSMNLIMGKRFRPRSAKNVFEEIKYIYETLGINYFKVMDDNFSLNKTRVIELCNLIIQSGMKMYFETPNGLMIHTLDKELVESMYEAGFIRVSLAVESGSEYIRNKIFRKNVSNEKIYEVFDLCKKYNMITKAFFVIGAPEETMDSILETKKMIMSLNCDNISLFRLIPFPGTRLFDQCRKDELFCDDFQMNQLWSGEYLLSNIQNDKFFIRPYKLDMETLTAMDLELRSVISDKIKKWTEHVRR